VVLALLRSAHDEQPNRAVPVTRPPAPVAGDDDDDELDDDDDD